MVQMGARCYLYMEIKQGVMKMRRRPVVTRQLLKKQAACCTDAHTHNENIEHLSKTTQITITYNTVFLMWAELRAVT